MKAFHTIAVPHKDILEGRLTMDVFAADLWEAYKNRGPEEYRDSQTFFKKTYMTEGLQNLLGVVEKRLKGKGGDPIIQIQTPFGGGKTHALIAMYHKSIAKWKAKRVVIVGTALSPDETLWGTIEKQLTGENKHLQGEITPGKEAIRKVLERQGPTIILMDEVLEYVTKTSAKKVEQSTLATQTIAFMHEFTEAVKSLDKVCLVATLPSSDIEHYDANAERLFKQLEKVAGRVEKIYTPVQDSEITKIIRRRLFGKVSKADARRIVDKFVSYAEEQNLIPAGMQPTEYRDKFIDSYPFMPEVVDVLYQRWGSYPTFQRTRGVLRLLSLIVFSLKETNTPYISPADFDLGDQEIRQELIKHIGSEFNSVINSDISNQQSGARLVDKKLGSSYLGLKLGLRSATTVFIYSFSGGIEKGATAEEIKRCATTIDNPSSVVIEAIEKLRNDLFFLQKPLDKYFFSNKPNRNRLKLSIMENIKDLGNHEYNLLRDNLRGSEFLCYLWEDKSKIEDKSDLKLIILKEYDKTIIQDIIQNKGQSPRVYRNSLVFLCPEETERAGFIETLKIKLACEQIDKTKKDHNLSIEQIKENKEEMRNAERDLKERIRRLYRTIVLPSKDGFKEIPMGLPTYGEKSMLDQEVFQLLCSEQEILRKITPLFIKQKYLINNEYALIKQLFQSAVTTPGEPRPQNKDIFEQGIAEGVRVGIFGLGELEADEPICHYFSEDAMVSLGNNEIIIQEEICKEQRRKAIDPEPEKSGEKGEEKEKEPELPKPTGGNGPPPVDVRNDIHLAFSVPVGKVSNIMGMMNLLQSKFKHLEIEISATNGEISEQDYEDKIKETLRQLGISAD